MSGIKLSNAAKRRDVNAARERVIALVRKFMDEHELTSFTDSMDVSVKGECKSECGHEHTVKCEKCGNEQVLKCESECGMAFSESRQLDDLEVKVEAMQDLENDLHEIRMALVALDVAEQ